MPSSNLLRKLTYSEVPDGTLIGVISDIHIGIHDAAALNCAIECMEGAGAEIGIANGDIHDCGPVSPHASKARLSAVSLGTLLDESLTGRPFIQWLRTRRLAIYGEGNHEDWINDVAVRTNTVGSLTVRSALDIPNDIEVLPQGYQIRLGSLVIEHGDIILGRSTGGVNLARTILTRCPDQTTIVGHFHRDDYAIRTSPDRDGVPRSHAAHALGHFSIPTAHTDYAGRYPQWQQSFALVRVYYVDLKPRFTVDHVVIHRDRRGRPFCEYGGRVYR